MQGFPVRLPSGAVYWTVIDRDLAVVLEADRYLRHVRFGQDGAELTTRTYAGAIALYLRWCERTSRDWRTAAEHMGMFMTWLRHAPASAADGAAESGGVFAGPGREPVRGERRVNLILAAVRGFLLHAVNVGSAPAGIVPMLYEMADARDVSREVRGEGSMPGYRLKARHHLREPHRPVDRASDEEIVALLRACLSSRDRLIVLLMARAGLRRSEVAGLRREDIHFLVDASVLGCTVPRSHLHVVRRDNPNNAWAKSRRSRPVPVDSIVVQAHDQYIFERGAVPGAAASDFLLVNLFREPIGAPMRPGAINDLITALGSRAALSRQVTPHMLRHGFGSNLADAGSTLDEIQSLLGHASPESSGIYVHPGTDRLRAAVERVPSPRLDAARS